MKFTFDTCYTPEEQAFIHRYNCKVLDSITLQRVAFGEAPRRMLVYCGTTLGEIWDEGQWWWAVLGQNRRGEWDFTVCYPNLPAMAEGL